MCMNTASALILIIVWKSDGLTLPMLLLHKFGMNLTMTSMRDLLPIASLFEAVDPYGHWRVSWLILN